MRVKLGDHSQFSGEDIFAIARANTAMRSIFAAVKGEGLVLTPIHTGKGMDVWFELSDTQVEQFEALVAAHQSTGMPSYQTDDAGTYLDVPVIVRRKQRFYR